MSEIKWFVHVVFNYRGDDQRPSFYLLRAHSWQDAYDSIRKDRFAERVWSLFPLERDGTYHTHMGFQVVDSGSLRQAGFEPTPTRDR